MRLRTFAVVVCALGIFFVSGRAFAQEADAGANDGGSAPVPTKAAAAETGKDDAKEEKDDENEIKAFALEGYVNLGFGARVVPRAVPSERLGYGLRSSLAGLIVRGTPFERFSYVVHFGVNPEAIELLSEVDSVDTKGDDSGFDVDAKKQPITLVPVEEVSISYAITPWWSIKGGHFYMRFSPGASVLVTSQMFPTRPEPTRVFMIGADQGLSSTTTFFDERLEVTVGAFNGSSLELQVPGSTALGPVYSAFIDTQPLGKMPDTEGDPKRGPFRFAVGAGGIYRSGKLFESTGYEATQFQETRFDAAARIAFRGLFLQAEYLRRLLRDDLSSRPASATGAYAQGSYFIPIPRTRLALAPLARYGFAIEDQDFFPRRSIEIEAGVAFYPRADIDDPNKVRLIVQYEGEQRVVEKEIAHGAVAHMQLRW